MIRTVILVPYRPDGGHRDRLWQFTKQWLQDRHPLYEIFEGHSPDGPFNRSAAVNDAASQAGDWQVAVIADADTIVPARQLRKAVAAATLDDRLVAAFTSVIELDKHCTENILTAGLSLDTLGIDRVRTDDIATQSSALAINRFLWDKIGGFDEKFIGWGGEDNAFWKAAEIHGGTPKRIDGSAIHLWHEPAADRRTRLRDAGYQANLQRWKRYARARTAQQLNQARES